LVTIELFLELKNAMKILEPGAVGRRRGRPARRQERGGQQR
jgi:hypothetical protein